MLDLQIRYVGFSGLPLDAFTYILDRHGFTCMSPEPVTGFAMRSALTGMRSRWPVTLRESQPSHRGRVLGPCALVQFCFEATLL